MVYKPGYLGIVQQIGDTLGGVKAPNPGEGVFSGGGNVLAVLGDIQIIYLRSVRQDGVHGPLLPEIPHKKQFLVAHGNLNQRITTKVE